MLITLILFVLFLLVVLKIWSYLVKPASRYRFSSLVNTQDKLNPYFTVGFLHPFCHSGGGGERVLWSAIKALQDA
jgi:alpha-1,2-mannosyltransferase